jgi:hypothetical protein
MVLRLHRCAFSAMTQLFLLRLQPMTWSATSPGQLAESSVSAVVARAERRERVQIDSGAARTDQSPHLKYRLPAMFKQARRALRVLPRRHGRCSLQSMAGLPPLSGPHTCNGGLLRDRIWSAAGLAGSSGLRVLRSRVTLPGVGVLPACRAPRARRMSARLTILHSGRTRNRAGCVCTRVVRSAGRRPAATTGCDSDSWPGRASRLAGPVVHNTQPAALNQCARLAACATGHETPSATGCLLV